MNAICTECGNPCQVIVINHGIGSYEYWGAKEIHDDIQVNSNCCFAFCKDENGKIITREDVIDYYTS